MRWRITLFSVVLLCCLSIFPCTIQPTKPINARPVCLSCTHSCQRLLWRWCERASLISAHTPNVENRYTTHGKIKFCCAYPGKLFCFSSYALCVLDVRSVGKENLPTRRKSCTIALIWLDQVHTNAAASGGSTVHSSFLTFRTAHTLHKHRNTQRALVSTPEENRFVLASASEPVRSQQITDCDSELDGARYRGEPEWSSFGRARARQTRSDESVVLVSWYWNKIISYWPTWNTRMCISKAI